MGLVAFDTLKFANQLQAGNFTPEQAQAMTAAMVEAMAGAELATKSDLVAVRGDIAAVKHELEKKIDSVSAEAAANKTELKNDIAMVRTELAALDQRMTAGFRDIEQKMTIKLGGMLVIITGILLAAIRYLGH